MSLQLVDGLNRPADPDFRETDGDMSESWETAQYLLFLCLLLLFLLFLLPIFPILPPPSPPPPFLLQEFLVPQGGLRGYSDPRASIHVNIYLSGWEGARRWECGGGGSRGSLEKPPMLFSSHVKGRGSEKVEKWG